MISSKLLQYTGHSHSQQTGKQRGFACIPSPRSKQRRGSGWVSFFIEGFLHLQSRKPRKFWARFPRTTQQDRTVRPEIGKRNSHSRIRTTSTHCSSNQLSSSFAIFLAASSSLSIIYDILKLGSHIIKEEGEEQQLENFKFLKPSGLAGAAQPRCLGMSADLEVCK